MNGHPQCRVCNQAVRPSALFCQTCGSPVVRNSPTSWWREPVVQGGCGLLLIIVVGVVVSNRATTPAGLPPVEKPKNVPSLEARMSDSKRLLSIAKASDSSEVIWRAACQIPTQSPLFAAARKEQDRAERIWDRSVGVVQRAVAARTLQDGYYRKGKKVKCIAIEGNPPTLRMSYILFGETTAYEAEKVIGGETAKILTGLGFQRVLFDNGFGESSSSTWKTSDVKDHEFSWIRSQCSEVRSGLKSPDTIGSTPVPTR